MEALNKIETKLADLCSEKNMQILNEEISNIDSEDGGINTQRFWKLKKKLCPKIREPPSAKLDSNGKLITSKDEINKLYVETYKSRLQPRKIKKEMEDMKLFKEETFELRRKLARLNPSKL